MNWLSPYRRREHGLVTGSHATHLSGRICHYSKWPSLGAGPLLLNIDAIGVECSRVLQPARIQRRPNIEHYECYK